MADSPLAPTANYRLIGKSESIRCLASRGVTGFALGFTCASIIFMLSIHLNPSISQFSFRSSRRYHLSKVFAHVFSTTSFSPPPYIPHSTTNLESSAEQVSSTNPSDCSSENAAKDHKLEDGNSPSDNQISRKEGSGLAPKGSYHMEELRNNGSQNDMHPPTAMNNSMQPKKEETSSPSPDATNSRIQPQHEEPSPSLPDATSNRIQPQQEEPSPPLPDATNTRIQPQQEDPPPPLPYATNNRIQPQQEEPSPPLPDATNNRIQPQQEDPPPPLPYATNNRIQPQQEDPSPPLPYATNNRIQPHQEELSPPLPDATNNRIQPQQEEPSPPSPDATNNRIQPQHEESSSPLPIATDNRIQTQQEDPSSPLPTATDNRIQSQQEQLSSSSPIASQNVEHSKDRMEQGNSSCDMFEGSWVRDDSYPLYKAGSCPYIDEPFDCFHNGRSDNMFEKYRWQPKHCNLPRLNDNGMLEILRGKRLVFVGDSLNRNMWESLVCTLRNSVEDKSSIFEASGREEFRTEGSYSFIFREYNCSIEFFRSVFLVQEWEISDMKGSTKETLRLDLVERSCDKYKDADILIFNTGHWWTHEKRTEGKDYYQEGDYIHEQMDVEEAFHKALMTWSQWVDANIDPKKTIVFFRGYSPSHFRDGEWNSGGQCHKEKEPRQNESDLPESPPMMKTIESVIERMKTPVFYLNITEMTYIRHDAHPSLYRNANMTEETKRYMLTHQDCSHWCLPGVPDLWNELVYAHLLYSMNRNKGNHQN